MPIVTVIILHALIVTIAITGMNHQLHYKVLRPALQFAKHAHNTAPLATITLTASLVNQASTWRTIFVMIVLVNVFAVMKLTAPLVFQTTLSTVMEIAKSVLSFANVPNRVIVHLVFLEVNII